MRNSKKAMLVILPDGTAALIPIDPIPDYPIIRTTAPGVHPKFELRVYRHEIPGGASDSIGPNVIAPPLEKTDIEAIEANGCICYVEVDWKGDLSTPSNGHGDKFAVIFLQEPKEEAGDSKAVTGAVE